MDMILKVINDYENRINNAKDKEEIKQIVREMFSNDIILGDIDFTNLIYHDVIPKLEELGVVFDRENEIDYERVLKEDY